MASSVVCVQMADGTENFLRSWPTGDTHHPHVHDYWSHGHTRKSKELENAVLDWAAIFLLNSILWKWGTIFV